MESKQLKDVLHLYLGCEVFVSDSVTSGIGRLTTVSILGTKQKFRVLIGAMSVERYFNFERDKPILRKLSSMTEEEGKIYVALGFGGLPVMKGGQRIIYTTFTPPCLNWLRKNSFDCDELIESGLAIDASTLSSNNQIK